MENHFDIFDMLNLDQETIQDKELQCKTCKKIFKRKKYLKYHNKVIHS